MTYLPIYATFNIRLLYSKSRTLYVSNITSLRKKREKKRKENIIIIYVFTDKEQKTERSVMRWSERADKNGKENNQNVFEE